MSTLYVRSSGLGSLYIDFQERARFTIGVMSRAVREAMERSAARASLPFHAVDSPRYADEAYADEEVDEEAALAARDVEAGAGASRDSDGGCCDGDNPGECAGPGLEAQGGAGTGDRRGGKPGGSSSSSSSSGGGVGSALGAARTLGASAGDAGEPRSRVSGFAKEFFSSRFGSITLSGWGITALASKETAFGSIPWSFDNIYVGESLEQARELYTTLFVQQARLEHRVAQCAYSERDRVSWRAWG
jgi:hypothetical protein